MPAQQRHATNGMCPVCGSQQNRRIEFRTGVVLHRCRACRIVHWGRVWESEEAVEYYHDYYAGKPTDHDAITAKRYHAVLDRFARLGASSGRLLDVGCGMGHFLAVAEARGWQGVGLEVSKSGVQMLKALKAKRGWAFDVYAMELEEADFPPDSFRAITLVEVLEHLSDPMAGLRKMYDLLEPGGILYLTTPNFDSLSRMLLGGRWRCITGEHLCLFNPAALRRCLEESGFRLARVITKNVDVPEILAKWKAGPSPTQPVKTASATRALRETVEGSRGLRLAKEAVNLGLRLTQLGETLEAFAVKPALRTSTSRVHLKPCAASAVS